MLSKSRHTQFAIGLVLALPLSAGAWTGPTGIPPAANVEAPINVSLTNQFKPGTIGANALNIYGSAQYLNFGTIVGAAGFGMRNNAGTIEFKNTGGAWGPLYSSQWGSAGSSIFYNIGNIGIGTTAPSAKLSVGSGASLAGLSAMSTNFLTHGGNLGATANDELLLGSLAFGHSGGNQGALGFRALRTANGNEWPTSAIGIGMDVDNTPHAGASMWLHANGNIGIGTQTPTAKLDVAGTIKQGSVARPQATWSVAGASTGAVILKLPGAIGNYGMLHMQIDMYEYDTVAGTTFICSGHNWGGAWHNYACNTLGTTTKSIRLAFKDGQYAIVIGNAASSWNYGHVTFTKISNPPFYSNAFNLGGTYTIAQSSEADNTYTWLSPDLNHTLAAHLLAGAPLGSSASQTYYNIGAGRIAANDSIYSYGSICAGNSAGNCQGTGGVVINANGNVTAAGYFHSSDARLKSNIVTSPGLTVVAQLRGVTFNWKRDGRPSSGVIAQEVEQVLPAAIHTDTEGIKSIEYDQLIAPLIEAIKEQQSQIQQQGDRINSLEYELQIIRRDH